MDEQSDDWNRIKDNEMKNSLLKIASWRTKEKEKREKKNCCDCGDVGWK